MLAIVSGIPVQVHGSVYEEWHIKYYVLRMYIAPHPSSNSGILLCSYTNINIVSHAST